jgi:hypothetical protein
VLVPIQLSREIASERETAHLLRSQTMKQRLLAEAQRQDGLSLKARHHEWCGPVMHAALNGDAHLLAPESTAATKAYGAPGGAGLITRFTGGLATPPTVTTTG